MFLRNIARSVFLICLVGSAENLSAQQDQPESSPLAWLPQSTAAYIRLEPAEQLLDHPLRKQAQASPVIQALWNSDQLKQPRLAIASFEMITATRLETVVRKLTAGGVHIAVDAESQGVVILAKSESDRWLREYLKRILLIVRNDAKTKQQPDPVKERTYRGIQGYEYQSNIFAAMGPWLMLTNKSELAKTIIDRYRDSADETAKPTELAESIRSNPRFSAWQSMVEDQSKSDDSTNIARAFFDLEVLRKIGAAKELLGGKANDFGGELILGGVLAALQHTPLVLGQLSMTSDGLQMSWQVPNRAEWIGEAREYYAGPDLSGDAPKLLELPGSIATISTYRNLSLMWLRSGDLFDQRVNDELAQADNTLTTLFSGKDFGEDILGAIEPQLQVVVVPPATESGQPAPSVLLPRFALRGTMKASTSLQRELRRIYQNAIGFLNIVGAMEGNPQLDMQSEKDPQTHSEYYWAEYVPDSDKKYPNGLPMQFNFQPCLAFQGQSVIVSSHVSLARQIVANPQNSAAEAGAKHNTELRLRGEELTSILRSNREQLVSNNVLEKGHSRKQAESEVDILLEVLAMFSDFQASLDFQPQAVSLSMQLQLAPDLVDPK